MQRLDYSSFLAKFESRTQSKFDVVAQLHDMKEVNKDLAKVIVSFSVDSHDKDKNFLAVANLFDGMARPIEGSFRMIPSNQAYAAVGFVTKNTEVRSCTVASLQKYKVMAGNLLMDETDESLWELKTTGGSKYITRHSEETLGELVALASIKHHGELVKVGSLNQLVMASVQNGEYVVYVSPKSLEVKSGFVLASGDSIEVLDVENDSLEEIDEDSVIESAYLKTSEIAAEVSMPSQGSKSAMREYYKNLYSYAPDYFKKMSEIIDSNAAL